MADSIEKIERDIRSVALHDPAPEDLFYFASRLRALANQEPIATTLASDPLDDEPGEAEVWFSRADWRALAALPPGTKLYTIPKTKGGE